MLKRVDVDEEQRLVVYWYALRIEWPVQCLCRSYLPIKTVGQPVLRAQRRPRPR